MRTANIYAHTFFIGFALFAAFFGAGNLIFPPAIGLEAGGSWLSALFGFALSGILLPILSFIAAARAEGTEGGVASLMGTKFSAVFTSVIMFCCFIFTIPRTAAAAHELGTVQVFGSIPQLITSSIFFAIVIFFSINPSKVVDKVGRYLTPALLVIMAAIIVKGILSPLGVPENKSISQAFAFHTSFVKGYQTMDTFGGLIFSGVFFAAIASHLPGDSRAQIKMAYGCGTVAGLILLFIYGGLIYIGATGSSLFDAGMGHAALLDALIDTLFGALGPVVLGVAAIFACLTTAIGATIGISYFFSRITKGKLPCKTCAIIICVISFAVSTLGVERIIRIAEPMLSFLYPAVIVLVLLNIFRCRLINRGTFFGAVYSALAAGFLEMLKAVGIKEGVGKYIASAVDALPFSEHGFSWFVPALIFGICATVIYHFYTQ